MVRERLKWITHEADSINVLHRGGQVRSSVEAAVMVVEQRGHTVGNSFVEKGGKM